MTFGLYQRIKAGEGQQVQAWAPFIKDGSPYTITLDGRESVPWRAAFEDLPVKDESNTNYYEYAVKELSCSTEDYQLYDRSLGTLLEDRDSYYMTTNGGNIWNIQKTVSILVKKEDEADQFLPGAVFQLTKDMPGHPLVREITFGEGDSEGIRIEGLVSGDYLLTETKAPDGYVIETKTLAFTVNAADNGAPVIAWKNGEQPAGAKALSGANKDTITVINTPGAALPMTGGPGTLPFVFTGTALTLSSALLLTLRMRYRILS